MLKRIFIVCAAIAFMGTATASGRGLIDFGIKGGLTTNGLKLVNSNKGPQNLSIDGKAGFHVGFVSRINLPLFHIQPEILYNHISYNLKSYPDLVSSTRENTKVKVNTVEFPVMFGLRLLWLRFQAGPSFNLHTESSVKSGGYLNDVIFKKPTVGYALGVGFDMMRLNLDIRYNGQFARPDQNISFTGETGTVYKTKLRNWMFSVGYVF